jgi:flagellar motor protein MotB
VLSARRAQSAKNFLASKHSISPAKLKAVGKGSTELADPANPEDGVNRRVRIIVEG